jgi:hypothetical protein
MTKPKNERKKLTLNKLTIWNLDHQVNLLKKGEQKHVKGGSDEHNNCTAGTTKLPVYCGPIIN